MEDNIDCSETMAADAGEQIKEFLRFNPIQLSPWEVATFFENEQNFKEEDLDLSISELLEKYPDLYKEQVYIIEELEKFVFLSVPLIRSLSITTLLGLLREISLLPDALSYIPNFPKKPAPNMMDHFLEKYGPKAKYFSDEEKKKLFQDMIKSTPSLLDHLESWKQSVKDYLSGLEEFRNLYNQELSDIQRDRINIYADRSRLMIPQIDSKIDAKKSLQDEQEIEFESFYKILKADSKFNGATEDEKREKIREIFESTDETVRKILINNQKMPTAKQTATLKTARRSMTPSTSRPIKKALPAISYLNNNASSNDDSTKRERSASLSRKNDRKRQSSVMSSAPAVTVTDGDQSVKRARRKTKRVDETNIINDSQVIEENVGLGGSISPESSSFISCPDKMEEPMKNGKKKVETRSENEY